MTQNIHISNPSASAVTFTLSIGADAAATRLYGAFSVSAGQVIDQFVKWVVDAAEIVTVSAGTNNVLVLVIDGVESTP